MKIIFLTIQYYFISNIILFSQNDSLVSELEYYPLQIGNYFEYSGRSWELPYYDDSSFTSLSIIGDTLLENGEMYKILLYKNIPKDSVINKYFQRIDSLNGSVYEYFLNDHLVNHEYKIDSLFAQIDDTIKCSRTAPLPQELYQTFVTNIRMDTVLGVYTEIKSFWDASYIPGYQYDLAKGFGFYSSFNCEFSCGSSKLVYAKIDGKEYGEKIIVSVKNKKSIPANFHLFQNYPNPFNPVTKLSIYIPKRSKINLSIYNIQGKLVKNITNSEYNSGTYNFEFDGDKLSTGIYITRLKSMENSKSIKMLLLK